MKDLRVIERKYRSRTFDEPDFLLRSRAFFVWYSLWCLVVGNGIGYAVARNGLSLCSARLGQIIRQSKVEWCILDFFVIMKATAGIENRFGKEESYWQQKMRTTKL